MTEWNRENAAHLFRRAAFGATPEDLDLAVQEGIEATVDRLLNYAPVPNDDMAARIAAQNLDLATYNGILRYWTMRLLFTSRPLEERMTLFWHDHFATAISKVGDPAPMLAQNELFRRFATGNFVELTIEVSKDVAMLLWLDNFTSVKSHPNENYGRELLELFTLGQGHYSELDVMSAARAFTGWTIDRRTRAFIFRDPLHDHGQKDFLGRVGDWDGGDVVRIACDEFAHGRLIASKLFGYFAYAGASREVIDPLAQLYLDGGHEIAPLVRAILTHEEMYSPRALWTRIKSPVDHAIIAWRQLRTTDDRLARLAGPVMSQQGQALFNPPDVEGWDGEMAWVSSGALLSRMNYANSLTQVLNVPRFLGGATVNTPQQMVDVYLDRLGPLPVSEATKAKLVAYVAPAGTLPTGNALLAKQQGLAHMILSLPEWQMV